MQDIKKYIDKYKTDLPQEIFDSQEYSIKLLQIPKISNTNRHDLSVEFVNWNALSDEDRENYNRISTIIKDKVIVQRVSNASLMRPGDVINTVKQQSGVKLSYNDHTLLWKCFKVRPQTDAAAKFDTISKYCIYDEPHNDYLYSEDWVSLIVRLLRDGIITKETLREFCAQSRVVSEYESR